MALAKLCEMPYAGFGNFLDGHLYTTALFSSEFVVAAGPEALQKIQTTGSGRHNFSFGDHRRRNYRNCVLDQVVDGLIQSKLSSFPHISKA
jgi:hypothetical protein